MSEHHRAVPGWFEDAAGRAAIRVSDDLVPSSLTRGEQFVGLEVERVFFVSVYCSPASRRTTAERLRMLEMLLDEIDARCPRKAIIIGGDFNAHGVAWGDATWDARGRLMSDWASARGLVLLNTGLYPTCVRVQGVSYVDVTWA